MQVASPIPIHVGPCNASLSLVGKKSKTTSKKTKVEEERTTIKIKTTSKRVCSFEFVISGMSRSSSFAESIGGKEFPIKPRQIAAKGSRSELFSDSAATSRSSSFSEPIGGKELPIKPRHISAKGSRLELFTDSPRIEEGNGYLSSQSGSTPGPKRVVRVGVHSTPSTLPKKPPTRHVAVWRPPGHRRPSTSGAEWIALSPQPPPGTPRVKLISADFVSRNDWDLPMKVPEIDNPKPDIATMFFLVRTIEKAPLTAFHHQDPEKETMRRKVERGPSGARMTSMQLPTAPNLTDVFEQTRKIVERTKNPVRNPCPVPTTTMTNFADASRGSEEDRGRERSSAENIEGRTIQMSRHVPTHFSLQLFLFFHFSLASTRGLARGSATLCPLCPNSLSALSDLCPPSNNRLNGLAVTFRRLPENSSTGLTCSQRKDC